LEIVINDDENVERALRRFKRMVLKAGILADVRKHQRYEKPSERRKREREQAARNSRRRSGTRA